MKKNLFLFVLMYFALFALFADEGKKLYVQKACLTCHGVDGKKPIAPNYPTLNSQNAVYLIEQFKLIKSGKRASGLSIVMKPFTLQVSDDEMKKIAEYLASVKN